MRKLAVCLLSCGRHDLTQRCVDTFLEHNGAGIKPMVLMQADEPAMGLASRDAGARAGFMQVHGPSERGGQMAALRALVGAAAAFDCSHVLWLENDWLTCRPLPWEMIQAPYDTLRLFGDWKRLDRDHPRAPAGRHLLGTSTPITWAPVKTAPGWEHGMASWAAGGSITRIRLLQRHLELGGLKEMMREMGPLATARPTQNIMHSVGDETTAGFMA